MSSAAALKTAIAAEPSKPSPTVRADAGVFTPRFPKAPAAFRETGLAREPGVPGFRDARVLRAGIEAAFSAGVSAWSPRAEVEPEPVGPVDDGRAAAFAEGVAEGRRQRDEELSGAIGHVAALLPAIEAAQRVDAAALSAGLQSVVMRLVAQVVEREVVADPAILAARVDTALALLKDEYEAARLALHPDDLALIEPRVAAFSALRLVADPRLSRGSLRLSAERFELDDGIEARLDRLRAALAAAL